MHKKSTFRTILQQPLSFLPTADAEAIEVPSSNAILDWTEIDSWYRSRRSYHAAVCDGTSKTRNVRLLLRNTSESRKAIYSGVVPIMRWQNVHRQKRAAWSIAFVAVAVVAQPVPRIVQLNIAGNESFHSLSIVSTFIAIKQRPSDWSLQLSQQGGHEKRAWHWNVWSKESDTAFWKFYTE